MVGTRDLPFAVLAKILLTVLRWTIEFIWAVIGVFFNS